MSTTAAFDAVFRGEVTALHSRSGDRWRMPVQRWSAAPDPADELLLAECTGPVLDLGCGPGRLVAALAERGVPVLGVDESPVAVALTRGRGGAALRRDVFGALPGEGRWRTALLADGNIGIGGSPAQLLARVHRLLAPDGVLIAELEPGGGLRTGEVRLGGDGQWFRWAWVGLDAIAGLAVAQGFAVRRVFGSGQRWFAVLRKLPGGELP